jgi:6-pyruvoyltetrahydropterin/6-carboxytetrahydropterin synthase
VSAYTIRKRYAFSASHVLNGLPEEHPCGRLHGHNYEVEVVCGGDRLDERAFVIDYREIDAAVKPIIEDLDHHHLNDSALLDGAQPSAERLACALFEEVALAMGPAASRTLRAVLVSETPKTWAEYRP